MATVETRKITKRFDGHPAVREVDLFVREGEFLVLVGPSGCGKTTLLRMLAGLEVPTSGDVLIGEHVVTPLPPRTRNIAMVFQSYALYPHLSVYSNIAFPLRAAGSPAHELQQLQRRLRTTTIYVTHDQIEAMGLGDRIAVLDAGRVHQSGTPSEVYD